jgi:hypothetical protein
MVFLGAGKGNEISFVLFKFEVFLVVPKFDIPLLDGRWFRFGFELFVGRATCRYQEGSEKYISQFHCRLLSEELLEVNKMKELT